MDIDELICKTHVNVAKAAKLLKISQQRIRALIKRPLDRRKRFIKAEKVGKVGWLIRNEEITRFKKLPAIVGHPKGKLKNNRRRNEKGEMVKMTKLNNNAR